MRRRAPVAARRRPGPRQAAALRRRRGDPQRPDDFSRGLDRSRGLFPRKGRGWGEQSEPRFPDLFLHWDQNTQWQSWRRGFALAHDATGGGLLTIDSATVLDRNAFWATPVFTASDVLLFRFASHSSPTGIWTVTAKPRGQSTSSMVLGPSSVRYETRHNSVNGFDLPVAVLDLGVATPMGNPDATISIVGELVDDSVDRHGLLLPVEGATALLCLQVDTDHHALVFDASRYWRYERNSVGVLVLREHRVRPGEHPPAWRVGHRLTESMVLSCNCPSHIGVEYLNLAADLHLGRQPVFPQQGGQGQISGLEDGEGIKRRFRPLQWERAPGQECKHCQAVRWMLGAPTPEPADFPSLDAPQYRDRSALDEIEEMAGGVAFDRAVRRSFDAVARGQRWIDADVTLLAGSVGDAFSVLPQVSAADYLEPTYVPDEQLGHDAHVSQQRREWEARQHLFVEPFQAVNRRFNRMQHVPQSLALQIDDARRGDWWMGRGLQTTAMLYSGAHAFEGAAFATHTIAEVDVDQLKRGLP